MEKLFGFFFYFLIKSQVKKHNLNNGPGGMENNDEIIQSDADRFILFLKCILTTWWVRQNIVGTRHRNFRPHY